MARAWVDPAYKERLLNNASAAIAELGYGAAQGEHMVVLENSPSVHNLVVCTLCSCYPWPILGLPPVWYKSAPYRSRSVIDPRGVLREFRLEVPEDVEVRVSDSTAEIRYLVLPERPAGTENMTEEELADLVTRDSMIGVANVAPPAGGELMNGIHDMGGIRESGSDRARRERTRISPPLGRSRVCHEPRDECVGQVEYRRRPLRYRASCPREYLQMSYYERWLARNLEFLVKSGLVTREEIESSKPAPGSQKATPPLTVAGVSAGAPLRGNFMRPPSRRQGSLRSGSASTTRPEYESGRPPRLPRYARGKKGCCRSLPRDLRVPGYKRAFSRRATAALVFGSFYGAGVVGRGRLAARFCLHGYVG